MNCLEPQPRRLLGPRRRWPFRLRRPATRPDEFTTTEETAANINKTRVSFSSVLLTRSQRATRHKPSLAKWQSGDDPLVYLDERRGFAMADSLRWVAAIGKRSGRRQMPTSSVAKGSGKALCPAVMRDRARF